MRTILLSLLCVLACGCTNRQLIVLTIEGGLGEVRLSYDPSRIAPSLMDESVRLSPFSEGQLVPPQLELCIAADSDYLDCGSRSLGSPNFFANADVNIKRGQGMLDFLDRVKVPSALEPVRQFRRSETSFWLCLERSRLAYYRGDDQALRAVCDAVDANTGCSAFVEQARLATTLPARDELARYGWHNCMNDTFHQRHGKYPMEHWRAFLTAYDIQETITREPE